MGVTVPCELPDFSKLHGIVVTHVLQRHAACRVSRSVSLMPGRRAPFEGLQFSLNFKRLDQRVNELKSFQDIERAF
jgi:hypothetical protein